MGTQFTATVTDAHLAGMDGLMSTVAEVIANLQQRCHDVLDLEDTVFDVDYLDFVVHVTELKTKLQVHHQCHLAAHLVRCQGIDKAVSNRS